jgi:hypothetical protein
MSTHKIFHYTKTGETCEFVVSWDHEINEGDTIDMMMGGGKVHYSGKIISIEERRQARGEWEHPHHFIRAKTSRA